MSTKNKKSNCDKKNLNCSTTLVCTRFINFKWNKTKKKQILKKRKNSKYYNTRKKQTKKLTILNFFSANLWQN